ncbi:hypothetical protein ACOBQX_04845 [Actinokineospora sp. G85]|uniref:hypothetical protein n=1 Tax=Actinokineospora sp. G85 TaxID=3406626 RepID=UPI003C70E642
MAGDRREVRVAYTDELLADGTVHRSYSDGRQEWRARSGPVVSWRDNRGMAGTDEALGRRIIKRVRADGSTLYGRDGGYGRTLWSDGVLTVNQTSFGGRMGAVLGAVAGGALLTAVAMPPLAMSSEEEEELRRQAADSGSGGGGEAGYSDWHGSDGSDDDFG